MARLAPGPGITAVSFHGTKLLLQDVEQSKLLSEVECGGGHRSWDILGTEKLVFIKEKKIFTQVFNFQGELPTCPGSHTQQINTMSSFRYWCKIFVELDFFNFQNILMFIKLY